MSLKNKTFRPLLAEKADSKKIKFPVMVSPKLDGIRCLIKDGEAVSRSLKPIPNDYIRALLKTAKNGFDGELITLTNGEPDDFNTIQSKVMSKDGTTDFLYYVFDDFTNAEDTYYDRFLSKTFDDLDTTFIRFVPQIRINNIKDLISYEQQYVDAKFEGIMLRDMLGRYKYGRSTINEGILLKMKRFDDSEAIVIGYTEKMENQNEKEIDALGLSKRSTKKENMIPAGTLGNIICKWKDQTIELGSGFTDEQRKLIWDNQDKFIRNLVTFSYQGIGPNGKPRFPVFLGFRKDITADD